MLEEALGETVIYGHSSAKSNNQHISPGLNASHYAPKTQLCYFDEKNFAQNNDKQIGLICFYPVTERIRKMFSSVFVLSQHANLEEAGQNLFQALYSLDALNLDKIYIEKCPQDLEIGLAIEDRVVRATNTKRVE
jgi:hypothetical protein